MKNKKIKIAFVTNTVFDLGGAQRVTTVLANHLNKKDYGVTIICTVNRIKKDYDIYNLDRQIEVITLKHNFFQKCFNKTRHFIKKFNYKTGMLKKYRRILKEINKDSIEKDIIKIIREKKIDVIIGVEAKNSSIVARIKKKTNCKCVGWQHSCFEAYFKNKGLRFYNEEKHAKWMLEELDKYVVLTNSDKRKIEEDFGVKSKTINNMVGICSKRVSNLEEKNFLAVGRLNSVKYFDNLIDAFSIFSKKNNDWNLNIIGEGEEREKLEEKVRMYGLENRISLTGFSNQMDKQYLYSSALLLTSKWEGMPMVVLEAFEMGLPVISYDIDVMKELIENDKNGILVEKYNHEEFAKQMLRIAEDEELRKYLGKNAKEKSKEFSYEKIGKEWEKLLKELGEENNK